MQKGHSGRFQQRTCTAEARTPEEDIVTLPFTRRTTNIYQRRELSIDSARLSIRIRRILIGVQYLDLIEPHKIDSAVTATLPFTNHWQWCRPFNMQLNVPESLPGLEITGSGHRDQSAVRDDPAGWSTVRTPPSR
jgi:hypothetical protein